MYWVAQYKSMLDNNGKDFSKQRWFTSNLSYVINLI